MKLILPLLGLRRISVFGGGRKMRLSFLRRISKNTPWGLLFKLVSARRQYSVARIIVIIPRRHVLVRRRPYILARRDNGSVGDLRIWPADVRNCRLPDMRILWRDAVEIGIWVGILIMIRLRRPVIRMLEIVLRRIRRMRHRIVDVPMGVRTEFVFTLSVFWRSSAVES